MSNLTDYDLSEIALASYADLSIGTTADQRIALSNVAILEKQANSFISRFDEILSQIDDPSSGFSATVFKGESGLVIGFRGTELGADHSVDVLSADYLLYFEGASFKQIVAMYNWWNRASNAPGNDPQNPVLVPQFKIEVESDIGRPVPDNGVRLYDYSQNAGYYLSSASSVEPFSEAEGNITAELLNAPNGISITGHSLGAHLAMAFSVLFPSVVDRAMGFNTPGFKNTAEINAFFATLGSLSSGPVATNTHGFENVFSKEVTSGTQDYGWIAKLHFNENPLGTELEVPIEDQWSGTEPNVSAPYNHSQFVLVDSLAVFSLLREMDQSFDIEEYYATFQRSAKTNHHTLEALVDSVASLFGVPGSALPSGNSHRNDLYEKISAIKANEQFQLAADATSGFSFVTGVNPAETAKNIFGHFLSLHYLTPFVFTANDAFLQQLEPALFQAWNARGFSDKYLQDRSLLRNAILQANAADTEHPAEINGQKIRFFDADFGEVFAGQTTVFQQDKEDVVNIIFGGDEFDLPIIGYDQNDRLYGMGGADQLYGGAGNDRLEGGFDSDADYLNGGEGYDTYVLDMGDTFEDPDDAGSIFFRNTRLTFSEAKQIEQDSNRYENSDGMVFELNGSTLKVFLPPTIPGAHAATGSGGVVGAGAPDFTIASFENGSFGIVLNERPEEPEEQDESSDPYAPLLGDAAFASSPIVLDLNGDGAISTTSLSGSNVFFDVDANGRAERTAWVGPQDGLLVRDINLDGRISSGLELFGSSTRSDTGATTPNGFVALSWLDSNADNRIDAGDVSWQTLQVWKDINQNGHSETSELFTLESQGVVSIGLAYSTQSRRHRAGRDSLRHGRGVHLALRRSGELFGKTGLQRRVGACLQANSLQRRPASGRRAPAAWFNASE